MTPDERGNRRRSSDPVIDGISDDVTAIKGSVDNIYKILNGNGGEGLTVRVDRNTQFRKFTSKALFIPLYAAIVAIIVKMLLGGQ